MLRKQKKSKIFFFSGSKEVLNTSYSDSREQLNIHSGDTQGIDIADKVKEDKVEDEGLGKEKGKRPVREEKRLGKGIHF